MRDQLVSFETAKLAKEKGFAWNCHWVLYRGTSSVLHKCDAIPMKGKNLESGDYVLQPTQSELQKWLREKHNVDINIIKDDCVYYDGVYDIIILKENRSLVETSYFEIYEEGLEKGLLEGLKLIDIKI
jgi:hypothetical protein